MENASDAIIIAGAILIFVIALTTAMTVFSQARATADTVIYASDETNFYEYIEVDSNVESRIVSWETVIPTLYKYYKENYTVLFLQSGQSGDSPKGLELYRTITTPELWTGYDNDRTTDKIPPIVKKYPEINDNKIICAFDVDDETKRHEPWTGSTEDYKNHLDAFLEGGTFNYPSDNNRIAYDYTDNGFIKRMGQNATFKETIGEYDIKEIDRTDLSESLDKGIRNKRTKRIIVYQEQ